MTVVLIRIDDGIGMRIREILHQRPQHPYTERGRENVASCRSYDPNAEQWKEVEGLEGDQDEDEPSDDE